MASPQGLEDATAAAPDQRRLDRIDYHRDWLQADVANKATQAARLTIDW
jgi:hypothetical protein